MPATINVATVISVREDMMDNNIPPVNANGMSTILRIAVPVLPTT
jgi:hypothetical protein